MKSEADMIIKLISEYRVLDIMILALGLVILFNIISCCNVYKKYKRVMTSEPFDYEEDSSSVFVTESKDENSYESIGSADNLVCEGSFDGEGEESLADILIQLRQNDKGLINKGFAGD